MDGATMLNPSTQFSPIRLAAYIRNEVEMEVVVRNEGSEPRWVECDVSVPEAISLAPDRSLSKGRMRIGIALPKEKISKKVKIYGGASSYPDTYVIRLTIYGYGKDGTIAERYDMRSDLRCERPGA
ncbi:MAG: hypothetical protein N3G22_00190 [Candidatus Micrarchaeota archaeon]|nr:hypothetical protein [Candidatus Micrarchaeota archaeon]